MTTADLITIHAKIKGAESQLATLFNTLSVKNPPLAQKILNIEGELLFCMATIEENIHETATGK